VAHTQDGEHGHASEGTSGTRRRLVAALALTASFLVVEVVAGVLSGSLALLSRLPAEEGPEARAQTGAGAVTRFFGLFLAATATLRARHVPQHLLDVGTAACEGRPPALPALDAPAHQAAPAFGARGSVP